LWINASAGAIDRRRSELLRPRLRLRALVPGRNMAIGTEQDIDRTALEKLASSCQQRRLALSSIESPVVAKAHAAGVRTLLVSNEHPRLIGQTASSIAAAMP
jgi:hypothetical protein